MNTSLSSRGYTVLKAQLSNQEYNNIIKELTVVPHGTDFMGPKPTPYAIYKESKSKLYLPKSYGIKLFGKPSVVKIPEGEIINLTFKGHLRHEQHSPVDAILKACQDPSKMGGILNLTCASGKTVLALYCLIKLGRKALIVVHKDFLLQQWKERINHFVENARIGLIKGKVLDVENKDIVLASLQSLAMKEYPMETFQDFGTLIVDEVHHTGAEVFCRALSKLVFRYTIGLTATVKRKDGLTKVFIWHLGDIAFSNVKSAKNDQVNVLLKDFDDDNTAYCKEATLYNGKINMSRMINNVCNYSHRTKFVVDTIASVIKDEPERKVLVLSDRRAHLHELANMIEHHTTDYGFYYGGVKENGLKESEGKSIIFSTYQYSSEGLDIKGLDTLVLASPKSDIVQVVGRILRDKPEDRKNIPTIIDIVDNFSIFSVLAKKRKAYYKKCKYNLVGEHDDTKDINIATVRLSSCLIVDDQ